MRNLIVAALVLFAVPAFAQYNPGAGHNAPAAEPVATTVTGKDGRTRTIMVEQPVARDPHGNAAGSGHDLAVDGAFDGQTVAVIQLYTGTDHGIPFDFAKPREALAEKGFSVYRWSNRPPAPAELEEKLKKASQLWIIGGGGAQLTKEHVAVVKRFFDSGRGVYLWGDNAPYSDDSNLLAEALFGVKLVDFGSQGEKVVGVHRRGTTPGIIEDHLLSTGIEQRYEGHTVSTLPELGALKPLIYGSDGRVVGAYYDRDGKRAILDGGYTRLYLKWETAGTGRYVKNAAAWRANAERFGAQVVAKTK
jgi:hypothetical protein